MLGIAFFGCAQTTNNTSIDPSALACSVCQGGTADNRIEFILTTALLTFLPLLLIGGVVYGLRRRYLSLARQEVDEAVQRIPRADTAPAPPSS